MLCFHDRRRAMTVVIAVVNWILWPITLFVFSSIYTFSANFMILFCSCFLYLHITIIRCREGYHFTQLWTRRRSNYYILHRNMNTRKIHVSSFNFISKIRVLNTEACWSYLLIDIVYSLERRYIQFSYFKFFDQFSVPIEALLG